MKSIQRSSTAFEFAFDRWRARFAARRRVGATVRALAVLDDRTLHDLGLGRSEVISAALESEHTGGDHTLRRRGNGQSPVACGFQCVNQ
jgi:uncharacterized protein YjiS (DUF1127 family)